VRCLCLDVTGLKLAQVTDIRNDPHGAMADFPPMLRPRTSSMPRRGRRYSRSMPPCFCDCTVSGRACTINSSALRRGAQNRLAGLGTALTQVENIVHIDIVQQGRNCLIEPGAAYEGSVALSSNDKATGNLDALWGEIAIHLPQGSVLPSHEWQVCQAQLSKLPNVWG
jgi:hypothetical protein